MLDEIRALCTGGGESDALELLDAYLREYPDDLDATLLKADLCLKLDRDPGFVGQAVVALEARDFRSPELDNLLTRIDARLREALSDGRNEVERHRWGNALNAFGRAVALAPGDPAVLLAAGMSLSGFEGSQQQPDGDDWILSLLHQQEPVKPQNVYDTVEDYLRRALEAAVAHRARLNGSANRLLAEARACLVRHLLAQGRVTEALDLLDVYGAGEMQEEISARLLGHILERIVTFARSGQVERGAELLNSCLPTLPDHALVRLLRADLAFQQDKLDEAAEHYRQVLVLMQGAAVVLTLPMLRLCWRGVQSAQLHCARCGKPLEAEAEACAYCAEALKPLELLFDSVRAGEITPVSGAHIGLAAILARQDRPAEAVAHLDTALELLGEGNAAREALEGQRQALLLVQQETVVPSLAAQTVVGWRADGLTPEVVAGVRRVCEQGPAEWLEVPFFTRRSLTRALVEGRHFALARQMMSLAFADNPARKSVQALARQLEDAIDSYCHEVLEMASNSLINGFVPMALDQVEDALALRPDDDNALLLRGNVREGAGQDLLALADYQALLARQCSPELAYYARISAARLLEDRFAFDTAREMLEPLDGEYVEEMRDQLDRREQGQPAVLTAQVQDAVQHDTLARVSTEPFYHGFFAVALRAVGRPWNGTGEDWYARVAAAGFEFVQVLGGLHSAVGAPVFALRIISRPDGAVAERGKLKVILLARVSAGDEAGARALALNLWETIHSMLPLSQDNLFIFEPVSSHFELGQLLHPFEVASMAQIVRRESSPYQDGDRYAVYPFTSGTPDLHNVFWTLLRQPDPAMISIHLLPTELLPWERTALDEVMLGERVVSMAATSSMPDFEESGLFRDSVSQWWQESKRVGQAYATRSLVDSLGSQAYVMQVNVASSSADNALLPEMVAAALFGPAGVANGSAYGGFEAIRATTSVEQGAGLRNLALVDVEGWVYSGAPEGATRLRHMVGEREAALTFRWPVPGIQGVPGMRLVEAKPVAPPAGLPWRGMLLGQSVARVNGVPLPIMQAVDDRRRHTYVVGKTGTGKSTLLKNMALQDIEEGRGVCVVDPHGDLIDDILERIPAYRMQDVIVFDPSDEERPIGLNLLKANSETERQRIVTEFIGLLVRMYDPGNGGIVGPRFQHNVRNAMLTAMSVEGGTLIEVVRVLTDPKYVRQVLPRVKDPVVRNYWVNQIANTSDFHKSEILDYIVSKFSRFVGDSRIRNIIGQRETTVDFRAVMDRQQVLLVNLSKGRIGPESAQFLGLLLVQSLLITALSRADLPRSQRPDFFLYVDEFQNFATELFATMLSEGRKYGIALTVANQYLTQLDHTIRDSIFGNVGSLVSFRLGTQDAVAFAPEMYPVFGVEDLLNLPKYTACVKLLVDGTAGRPFTLETLADLRPPDPGRAATIRQYSRTRYGRDASAVTADVLNRFRQE